MDKQDFRFEVTRLKKKNDRNEWRLDSWLTLDSFQHLKDGLDYRTDAGG